MKKERKNFCKQSKKDLRPTEGAFRPTFVFRQVTGYITFAYFSFKAIGNLRHRDGPRYCLMECLPKLIVLNLGIIMSELRRL